MNSIDMKAIFFGLAADWGATLFSEWVIFLVFMLNLQGNGMDEESIKETLNSIQYNPLFLVILFILGLGFTCLGGYVAARKARTDNLLTPAFVGAVGVVYIIVTAGDSTAPLWMTLTGIFLSIPVAMAGGIFHTRKVNLFQ